jgi:23S rRNA (adenine1618-N6)-methyltransferase
MPKEKKVHPKEKIKLHPRNKHRERYDFELLTKTYPELARFVLVNPFGDESIDFFNPMAVKMLNKALLKHYYQMQEWDIPAGYLCPPIPGRADYIHYLADLLSENNDKVPTGKTIKILDIGVGANAVYPIIGQSEYGWLFVGTDIDATALASATKLMEQNPVLKEHLTLRIQPNAKHIFKNIIQPNERFNASICNPPFHASLAEAQAGTTRKLKNLTSKKTTQPTLNFGGKNNELWTEGGELTYVKTMIAESKQFATTCCWFTTLISKESNLIAVQHTLKTAGATNINTIPMGQGNKISRMMAWSFLTDEQRKEFKAI